MVVNQSYRGFGIRTQSNSQENLFVAIEQSLLSSIGSLRWHSNCRKSMMVDVGVLHLIQSAGGVVIRVFKGAPRSIPRRDTQCDRTRKSHSRQLTVLTHIINTVYTVHS